MNEKLDWTQKLGGAFLAEQQGVMDAVQRLRAKAREAGNLESTKEQTVTVEPAPPPPPSQTTVVTPPSQTTVVTPPAQTTVVTPPAQTTVVTPPAQIIKIEPADPQVVYVPTYNPTVVYGAWPYPAYPPAYYYPPGYVAGVSLLSFGAGMAVGA